MERLAASINVNVLLVPGSKSFCLLLGSLKLSESSSLKNGRRSDYASYSLYA